MRCSDALARLADQVRHRHQQGRPGSPSRCWRNWDCARASPAWSAAIPWRNANPIPCRCCMPPRLPRSVRASASTSAMQSAMCRRRMPRGHAGVGRQLRLSARRRGLALLGRRRLLEPAARSLGLARGRAAAYERLRPSGWHCSPASCSAPWRRCSGARAANRRCASRWRCCAHACRARRPSSAEREQAAARAHDQLQGVFGELARESLQSNSEVFLQLARERLARQQLDASQALKERESAIESLVQPIRDALAQDRSADSEPSSATASIPLPP